MLGAGATRRSVRQLVNHGDDGPATAEYTSARLFFSCPAACAPVEGEERGSRVPLGRYRVVWAVAIAAVALAVAGAVPSGGAGDPQYIVTPDAAQVIYLKGVPHTDGVGRARTVYDPDVSFLPIGIYHLVPCMVSGALSWPEADPPAERYRLLIALDAGTDPPVDRKVVDRDVTGTSATVHGLPADTQLWFSVFAGGAEIPLVTGSFRSDPCPADGIADPAAAIASAGFNLALPWPGLHLSLTADAARAAGLRLVGDLGSASEATLTTYMGDPQVYGWYMADEPLLRARMEYIDPHGTFDNLALVCYVFCGRNDQVFFFTEWALPNDPWWPRFLNLGEAGVHDNYVWPTRGTTSLLRIAESVRAQTQALGEAKPSWFVVQAFGGGSFGIPTPAAMRGMVYTALIHGATGIFQFAWDSPVLRAGGSIGVRPNPPASYPGDPAFFTAEQIGAADALWDSLDAAQGGLNAELQALRPVILSPGTPDVYTVAVSRNPMSAAPVRTLLKTYGGSYYLLAVNIDAVSLDARITFRRAIDGVDPLFDSAPTVGVQRTVLSDHFDPFEAHVYRLNLRCPDVDQDGHVTGFDAVLTAKDAAHGVRTGDPEYSLAKDLNADGAVAFGDAIATYKLAGQTCR